MDATGDFLLLNLLPVVLSLLLIGLAAGLGIARWRWTLFVYALIALALYIFTAVVFYILNVAMFDVRLGLPDPSTMDTITRLEQLSQFAVVYSIRFAAVSAFLALVLAGRTRQWSWFTILLLAAVISAIAVEFTFSPVGLGIFIKDEKRALETFSTSFYTIVVNALALLAPLIQVLYAIFGARTGTAAAPAVSTASMSDDVTLP